MRTQTCSQLRGGQRTESTTSAGQRTAEDIGPRLRCWSAFKGILFGLPSLTCAELPIAYERRDSATSPISRLIGLQVELLAMSSG